MRLQRLHLSWVRMTGMTALAEYGWWRRLLAVAALLVGLVVMHAGLEVVSCSGQRVQHAAMSVHVATTSMDASLDASHNPSPTASDCGHGMGQICQAVLTSPSSHVVSALSLVALGGVLSALGVGAMAIYTLEQRRRRHWPRPDLTLSSLCILRI